MVPRAGTLRPDLEGPPYMGTGSDTYVHDVLKVSGGENVCGRVTRYPVITLEEIEGLRPEVVLLPNEPYPFSAEDLPEFYILDIPAAKEDRIYLVDGKLLAWYGPRMAGSLTQVSALLRSRGYRRGRPGESYNESRTPARITSLRVHQAANDPLTPAMRPFSIIISATASPIKSPPIRPLTGVKSPTPAYVRRLRGYLIAPGYHAACGNRYRLAEMSRSTITTSRHTPSSLACFS